MTTRRAARKKDASAKAPNRQLLAGYDELLRELWTRIEHAQVRAAVAVNNELVLLYWGIGRDILICQQQPGLGAKVVEQLATDLQRAFPEMKGFSRIHLLYMCAFAGPHPDEYLPAWR